MVTRSFTSHAQTTTRTARRGATRPARPARLAMAAADTLALAVATTMAGHASGLSIAYGVVGLLALLAAGTRQAPINPRLGQQLPLLVGRLAVVLLLLLVVPVLLGWIPLAAVVAPARAAVAAIVLVGLARALAYALLRWLHRRGRLLERAVIVGAGQAGRQLASVLRAHREYGLVPVGPVSAPDTGPALPGGDRHPLVATIRRHQAGSDIVAADAMGQAELVEVLRACQRLAVEVYVVPRCYQLGVLPDSPAVSEVWGIPLLWLPRPGRRRSARLAKRAFDLVVASVGLLVSAPLLLAVALAVRCSSPGPVVFRQLRIGQDGRPFQLLKFRTMQVNGDSDTTWSVAADARVTAIGRLLRRSCLDELPQLVNVVRGQMSLVGPRPERPHFVHRFARQVPCYADRHRVPPGMTGWAQVHGLRGDTPILDRARFDNYYIEHWSLWRDVVIVVRTLANVVLGR